MSSTSTYVAESDDAGEVRDPTRGAWIDLSRLSASPMI